MKKSVFFLMTMLTFLSVYAQECPPEWVRYTYGGYLYDIQSDNNNTRLPEPDFKNSLLNIARANLAKQIRMSVQDSSEMSKRAVDGRTSITYSSNTKFSTDLNMKLVETKSMYSPSTGKGYAIAYIDKDAAKNYYTNELTLLRNKISNSIELANSYIEAGFKKKAESELNESLSLFNSSDEALFWLNIFGAGNHAINEWQRNFNRAEQDVKRLLTELRHATLIYISCEADIFGKTYPSFQNELMGLLANDGCSFVNLPNEADWNIKITCSSEQHNNVKVGNVNSYITYVKSHIIIEKPATSQRVYEDEISAKGGHTLGYEQAARKAYNEVKENIWKTIKQILSQ